jgi:uncharacterized glyoxalase superfamily protein PhnB
MIENQSMPPVVVIPELAYRDVSEAVGWLCDSFGFTLRLRIANHRAQLNVGSGAIVVTEANALDLQLLAGINRQIGILVRVDDVDRHFARVSQSLARLISRPTDQPYGERQYACLDLGGYAWTFSQTIADVAPAAWGGVFA